MARGAVIAAALAPALALAGGRPPQTTGVVVGTDPHTVLVRTTFGLLVSKDAGCSYRWVCERAIGYGGDFEPKYAIASDGTLFATTFTGLRASRDGGCTWTSATGPVGDIWIDAIEIGPTGELWVATAESARPNDVYSSADNGATFRARGLASPTIWWKSVKVARSRPQRVYVTGYQVAGPRALAHLVRSDDGGATWTELPLPATVAFGATPIVLAAAVDPRQPDTLLLVSLAANGKGDRLYRSTDGGRSFADVLATADTIKGVVFAADHSVYVAASTGSFRSTDDGATFAPLAGSPQLGCIGQSPDGALVGCGANWEPDHAAVAVSLDGAHWTKQLRFGELAGPLACAPGTTAHDRCGSLWPALQKQFGATAPTGCPAAVDAPAPARSGGCCDAGDGHPLGALAVLAWILVPAARRRGQSTERQLG